MYDPATQDTVRTDSGPRSNELSSKPGEARSPHASMVSARVQTKRGRHGDGPRRRGEMSGPEGIRLPTSDTALVGSDSAAHGLVHSTVSPKPTPGSSRIAAAWDCDTRSPRIAESRRRARFSQAIQFLKVGTFFFRRRNA